MLNVKYLYFSRAGNKGYAFSFITPEQERYSGDIVRAFELAGVVVPEPLRALFEGYKAKQLAVSHYHQCFYIYQHNYLLSKLEFGFFPSGRKYCLSCLNR